jgi:hypothetical protein
MEKNIKFLAEEKGVKFYEYSFNGNRIRIIQDTNNEITFQGGVSIINRFMETEDYQAVCDYFGKSNI